MREPSMEKERVLARVEEYRDGLCAVVKQLHTALLARIVAVLPRAQENGRTSW